MLLFNALVALLTLTFLLVFSRNHMKIDKYRNRFLRTIHCSQGDRVTFLINMTKPVNK